MIIREAIEFAQQELHAVFRNAFIESTNSGADAVYRKRMVDKAAKAQEAWEQLEKIKRNYP